MQKIVNMIYAFLFYFYATTANIPMGVMPQIYLHGALYFYECNA
jgi:hypothetical protein